MKNTNTSRPKTLDVDQWRDVFARVDGLLDASHETLSETINDANTSHAGSNAANASDDAVDSVVRRWRDATQLNRLTLTQLRNNALGNALGNAGATTLTQPKADLVLGRYRLLERIGQGGMGSVWRAERTDGLYDGEVAIKLLGSLALSAHARARFAQEGQILARLKHPNIAGLIDAGITDDGQRYLVIELIDGVAINDYVEKNALDMRQRLQLFRQLLDAVAFAHERLVIHRDIKPANILITTNGTVKLLDFGVAKLLVEGEDAALTQAHGSAYTEAYAAPEQINGDAPTVVADVFSLGMILLELLSGKRATWANAKRKAKPGDHPEQLSKISPLDLRAIVHKALEVAPEDRYRSIAALDDDVRRFLANEPVAAHITSAGYGIKKFIRRNTLAVGATSAVILTLIVGASVATWQWREAKAQTTRAEAVKEFMARMFEDTDPQNSRGKIITAQDLLDRSAARLDTELQDEPEVRAELQARIGNNYNALGEHVKARVQLERAVVLFETAGSVRDPLYLDALYGLLEARLEEREFVEASSAAEKLRARAREAYGEPNRWLGRALGQLSWIATQSGDAVMGERLAREGLAQQLAFAKGTDAHWLSIASNLTEALIQQGKYLEAREMAATSVTQGGSVAAYSLSDRMVNRYNLARMDYVLNRYPQAVAELQPLVDEMGRHMGIKHPRTMNARNLLAQSLVAAGFDAEGIDVQRANLHIAEAKENAKETDDHQGVAFEELVLAKLYVMSAPVIAESYATRGLNFYDSKYERPTWTRERARWILSDAFLHQRRFKKADEQLAITLTNMQSLPGAEGHAIYADAMQTRALLRTAQSRFDEAAEDITTACAVFEKRLPSGVEQITYCKLYAAWIESKRTGAPPTAGFSQIKAQAIELIPANRKSYEAMLAMVSLIERRGAPVNDPEKDAVRWPISLSDMPMGVWSQHQRIAARASVAEKGAVVSSPTPPPKTSAPSPNRDGS